MRSAGVGSGVGECGCSCGVRAAAATLASAARDFARGDWDQSHAPGGRDEADISSSGTRGIRPD